MKWIILLTLLTSIAWADEPIARPKSAAALEHLTKGSEHYKHGDLAAAAAEYEAGEAIEAAPIFDYDLGQCYRRLGDDEKAVDHYEKFLAVDSRPGDRTDAVKKFVAQMREELDAKKVAEPAPEPEPAPTVVTVPVSVPAPRISEEPQVWWPSYASGGFALAAIGVGAYALHIDGHGTCGAAPPVQCRSLYDTAKLGWTTIGVGAAAAGFATYWFVRQWQKTPSVTATIAATSTGATMAVAGSF